MESFSWKKGDEIKLSDSFGSTEFSCQCTHSDCVDQKVSKELIEKLQKVRDDLGEALMITSGFRCHKHQLDLSSYGFETAKSISQHELGNAADIKASSFDKLIKLIENEFQAIGYSKRFLHVDLRKDRVRHWKYKN